MSPRPYSLPNPCTPLEDESLASLITRNAGRYSFTDPMLVVRRLGFDRQLLPAVAGERPPAATAEGLAALLGVNCATLETMASWGTSPNTAMVGGHQVRPRQLGLSLRRGCPRCLSISAHHRSFWDILAVQHCPVHGLPLQTRCGGCKRLVRWKGKRLDRCGNVGCHHDLSAWSGEASLPVPAYITGLDTLYRGGPTATLPGCELGMGRAAEVALAIGGFAIGISKMGRHDSFLRSQGALAHEAMAKGWAALGDWPHGLHCTLDAIREDAGGRGWRFGMRREFGGLHRWLYDVRAEPWATAFNDAFSGYLASQPDLRETPAALRRANSASALRDRHMTATDAAEYLGVAPQKMAELAERENLHLVPPSDAVSPLLFRADLVHALGQRKQSTLMKHEAEAILGVGSSTLRQLLEDGVLTSLPPDERVTHQRLLLRHEVEELVRRALDAVAPVGQGARLVSFAGAMAGRRNASTLIQAILSGQVVPRGTAPKRKGINALLLDSGEVEAALTPPRATMTLLEAAQRLGADLESVRAWASEGFLATTTSTSPFERGTRVTDDALTSFSAEHITSSEAGRQAGTSGRWAAERLEFQGHLPLPSASLSKLYRRGDITSAVLDSLRDRKSAGRAASAAFSFARAVADAVASELGVELQRSSNGFADAERGIYLQVLAGRRERYRSKYAFRFSGRARAQLEGASRGMLALALVEDRSFILLPWSAAKEVVPNSGRYLDSIYFAADARGVVEDEQIATAQRWLPPR